MIDGYTSGKSVFNTLENSLFNPDQVTTIPHNPLLRASVCEFMVRYPDIKVYVDDEYIYIAPSLKAMENLYNLMLRRKNRLEKRYNEISASFDNCVSLLSALRNDLNGKRNY